MSLWILKWVNGRPKAVRGEQDHSERTYSGVKIGLPPIVELPLTDEERRKYKQFRET